MFEGNVMGGLDCFCYGHDNREWKVLLYIVSCYQFYALQNAYNSCVLFYVMTEGNHDLCGGVTELRGICGL